MFSHTCHITWHIICKDKKYTTGQKSLGKTQENGNIFLSRVTEQSKGQDSYNTVEQEWGAGLVIQTIIQVSYKLNKQTGATRSW